MKRETISPLKKVHFEKGRVTTKNYSYMSKQPKTTWKPVRGVSGVFNLPHLPSKEL